MRMDWNDYFLNIAREVGKRSTCVRVHYGAVIVKNNIILSTGYNGAPRNMKSCDQYDYCIKDKYGISHGGYLILISSIEAPLGIIGKTFSSLFTLTSRR